MQKLNLKKVKPINMPNHCVLLSQNSKQPTKAQIKTKRLNLYVCAVIS